MEKIINLILVLLIVTFASILYQCSNENITDENINTEKLESRSSDDDCLPPLEQGCLQSDDTIDVSITMILYNIQNCIFKVAFRRQKCYVGSMEWTFNFGDFQIIEHNCPAFNQALLDNNGAALEWFLYQFNTKVRNAIIEHYLQTVQQVEGTRVNNSYYYASCMKACIIHIPPLGGSKGGGINQIIFVSERCGEDCCNLQKVYEFHNGEWVLISSGTISHTEICNPGFISLPCGSGTIKETDCFAQCSPN